MTGAKYSIMEHFYTLQGEGFWAGNAAYFIRLAGCDVGCTWCDVKESWDSAKHPSYSLSEIQTWLQSCPASIVVVTGGEPTLYDLEPLTTLIKSLGKRTHIETSGTNALTGDWDWVTFSPKRFKKCLDSYYQISNELKVIIAHRNDFRWANEFKEKMTAGTLLYIQPEWESRKDYESLCVDFVKDEPRWRLSLQTHKYLGID